jgi:hypothetical protein
VAEDRVERRLTTILAADVVGYSRLMAADEADTLTSLRLGQKNGRARIWAKWGTRPRLPADQRDTNADLFGAICSERGVGAALVLPRCNTQAMQWHLEEISSRVRPGAHAVLFADQAG